MPIGPIHARGALALAETSLLRVGTALMIDAANGHTSSIAGVDVEINARSLQKIQACDLRLAEVHAVCQHLPVAMDKDKASAVGASRRAGR